MLSINNFRDCEKSEKIKLLEYTTAYALNTIKEKIIVWYGRFYCSKNNLKKVKISIVIDKIIIIIIYININYLGLLKMNTIKLSGTYNANDYNFYLQEKIEKLEKENKELYNLLQSLKGQNAKLKKEYEMLEIDYHNNAY